MSWIFCNGDIAKYLHWEYGMQDRKFLIFLNLRNWWPENGLS